MRKIRTDFFGLLTKGRGFETGGGGFEAGSEGFETGGRGLLGGLPRGGGKAGHTFSSKKTGFSLSTTLNGPQYS